MDLKNEKQFEAFRHSLASVIAWHRFAGPFETALGQGSPELLTPESSEAYLLRMRTLMASRNDIRDQVLEFMKLMQFAESQRLVKQFLNYPLGKTCARLTTARDSLLRQVWRDTGDFSLAGGRMLSIIPLREPSLWPRWDYWVWNDAIQILCWIPPAQHSEIETLIQQTKAAHWLEWPSDCLAFRLLCDPRLQTADEVYRFKSTVCDGSMSETRLIWNGLQGAKIEVRQDARQQASRVQCQDLSSQEWREIQQGIRLSHFWLRPNLDPEPRRTIVDGSEWRLEAWRSGQYKIMSGWCSIAPTHTLARIAQVIEAIDCKSLSLE